MKKKSARSFFAFAIPALALLATPIAVSAADPPVVSRQTITGARGSASLRVSDLGRYAVESRGDPGARIGIVDRMSGEIAAGVGRVDSFLEPGEYKLVMEFGSPAAGPELAASAYRAVNLDTSGRIPRLRDGESEHASLGDLETRSYWIEVGKDDPRIVVEAMGRCLAGAALWREGNWNTGLAPLERAYDLRPGRPMRHFEFDAEIEPGLYLLTCWGGPRPAWGDDSREEPFSVRRGALSLGAQGSMRAVLGRAGIYSARISADASAVWIDAPDKAGYELSVSRDGGGRLDARARTTVDASSQTTRAILSRLGGSESWVVVKGPPGSEVGLGWIAARRADMRLDGQGVNSYYISVAGGPASDAAMDVSALVVRDVRIGATHKLEILADGAIPLSLTSPIRRRINNGSSRCYVRVETAGSYSVAERSKDVSAEYSFTQLSDFVFSGESRRTRLTAGQTAYLAAGYYLLAMTPIKRGVLDFAIGFASAASTSVLHQASAPSASLVFPKVETAGNSDTVLLTGTCEFSDTGIVALPLPLDLEEPVFLVSAAKGYEVEFELRERRRPLLEPADRGAAIDGAAPGNAALGPGLHRASVPPSGAGGAGVLLGAAYPRPDEAAGPERRPDPRGTLRAIVPGSPQWLDFGRGQTASFVLLVDEPAPYRVSTEGRLSMSLSIRGMLGRSLFESRGAPAGGNARVAAYLRPGVYLVGAAATGRSKGRAGVSLERLPMAAAGSLAEGSVSRAGVPAEVFLEADFAVETDGERLLECLGLGTSFAWRLEDGEGWPVGKPVREGALRETLPKGKYRYISYPAPSATRRVIRLLEPAALRPAPVDPEARTAALAPGARIQKRWLEREGRPEDEFLVDLPAPARASLRLDAGMAYRLVGPDGSERKRGLGGRAVDLDLAKGRNRIMVSAAERDNRKDYSIALDCDALFEGGTRVAQLGGKQAVSIGAAGIHEIWSYGDVEVEAILRDSRGKIVARSEQIEDDWNFSLVARLEPGEYSLSLAAPGARRQAGSTSLSLLRREEVSAPASTGASEYSAEIGDQIVSMPLKPAAGGLYRLTAAAPGPVRLELASGSAVLASGASSLLVPLEAGGAYTVRAWRLGSGVARLGLRAEKVPVADAALDGSPIALGSGLRVKPTDGASVGVECDAPLLWSPGPGAAFRPLPAGPLSPAGAEGWLIPAVGPGGRARLRPFELRIGGSTYATLADGPQTMLVEVPKGSVAVARADGTGASVGISSTPLGGRVSLDPRSGTSGSSSPVIGLRDGRHRLSVWDASGPRGWDTTVSVEAFERRGTREVPAGSADSFVVPARSAIDLALAGPRQTARVSLERGLVAFGWDRGPRGAVDAAAAPETGLLSPSTGSISVVNTGDREAMCSIRLSPYAAPRKLAEGAPIEESPAGPVTAAYESAPTGRASTVWIWGAVVSARLLSEDGRIVEAEAVEGEGGSIRSLPGLPGSLLVSASGGPYRLWLSSPAERSTAWADRPAGKAAPALPPEGAALSSEPRSWSLALSAETALRVRAEGAGLLALYDAGGSALGIEASSEGQEILRILPKGNYALFARPFAGTARSGRIWTEALSPTKVEEEGPQARLLAAPGEKRLYSFVMAVKGRAGIGVAAQTDDLKATLYDSAFAPVASGPLVVRELGPGRYLYLVENGAATQRLVPLFYGLSGERAEVPADVIKAYTDLRP